MDKKAKWLRQKKNLLQLQSDQYNYDFPASIIFELLIFC